MLYLENNEGHIYQAEITSETGSGESYQITYELELVAGLEHLRDQDWKGYVSANCFPEELMSETMTFYPMTETMKGLLSEYGYKVLDRLPVIHNIKFPKETK